MKAVIVFLESVVSRLVSAEAHARIGRNEHAYRPIRMLITADTRRLIALS